MKKSKPSRRLSAQSKRIIVVVSILLIGILGVYAEVWRPNQNAKAYVNHLEVSSKPLQECFEELSATTDLDIYYAPDIALDQKRKDTATILKQIDTCRTELKEFDAKAHDLINLRLSGYTAPYRQAKVYQRQAFDIAGQSNDVLNQYSKLATFLSSYYDHINAFQTYTQELQDRKFYLGDAQLTTMQQQATDLRQRGKQIKGLDTPAEFNTTRSSTISMFSAAAAGFDTVVSGYRTGDNFAVEAGYQEINNATVTYNSKVINLPFDQLIKSYIPKQVQQLPGKVENLLVSSVE